MPLKVLCCLLLVSFFLIDCNNADKTSASAGGDSAEAEKDSVVSEEFAYANCYENFFKGLPKWKDSAAVSLQLQSGQRVTVAQFFTDEFMGPSSRYGEKDLDGDGTTELVIYNNTGGAHCCDDYTVFQKNNDKEYGFKAHLAGSICIDAVTNHFTFSFNEMLGYFFGCYACGFDDSTSAFRTMREIELKYNGGKLEPVPYDAAAEKQNITNLEALQKHGFEKMEDMMDNGWRKEFAMNAAVWHYNHGKEWAATEKLFRQYYTFPDIEKIWTEFHTLLSEASKDNTF
ncbi:MAG: hypothetical protein INR73_19470 [Williamsia sp.]|nr:hypothetical protein [Williamsia sp.]